MRINVLIAVCANMLLSYVSYGQSRSSVGLGVGINQTLAEGYKTGSGYNLQGNIRISDAFGIVPVLGIEKYKADYALVHYGPEGKSSYIRDDIGTIYLGLGLKYYFNERWFARAGANLYLGIGNEDIVGGGIGANFAGGYDLPLDRHSSLELTFRTDLLSLRNNSNVTPVLGLRVAYNFNFRGL